MPTTAPQKPAPWLVCPGYVYIDISRPDAATMIRAARKFRGRRDLFPRLVCGTTGSFTLGVFDLFTRAAGDASSYTLPRFRKSAA